MFYPPPDDRVVTSPEPVCWRCMHSLRGLPGRFCPQCGAARDAYTAQIVRSRPDGVPSWARRFLTLPGAVFHAAVQGACLAALVAAALPGGLAPAAGIAIGSLTLLGLVWAVRAAAFLLTLALIRPPSAPRGAGCRFAIAPIVVLATVGMIALQLPARVAFRLSRPQMDRWVERVMCGDRAALREGRIGLYPARDISFTEHGVWFRVPWTMPNGGSGFLFSPSERPLTTGEMTYWRRGGGWYEWAHDF